VSYDRLMYSPAMPIPSSLQQSRIACIFISSRQGRTLFRRRVMVELLENVRGKDVFVLQSTCAPTNDNLMEVMVMVDALKRASAGRITAAMPYFGYARQDRRPRSARVAITAKVVADMLTGGVDRLLTMDLHSDQIQGFFDIPVDNIYASPILLSMYGRATTLT